GGGGGGKGGGSGGGVGGGGGAPQREAHLPADVDLDDVAAVGALLDAVAHLPNEHRRGVPASLARRASAPVRLGGRGPGGHGREGSRADARMRTRCCRRRSTSRRTRRSCTSSASCATRRPSRRNS